MIPEKIKLLVVEDEPDICTSVQSYFGKRGFVVSTTGSGLEALSIIKAAPPDLVLLDIALNDLSGIEVLKQIRECDQDTKVIVVTGQMYLEAEIQEILKLGVSGYENKPLILADLERRIGEILGVSLSPVVISPKKSVPNRKENSGRAIVHELANLLGIIRNRCENFTLNCEEGIYRDKSPEELVRMSVEIMKEATETVDQAMNVVERIER